MPSRQRPHPDEHVHDAMAMDVCLSSVAACKSTYPYDVYGPKPVYIIIIITTSGTKSTTKPDRPIRTRLRENASLDETNGQITRNNMPVDLREYSFSGTSLLTQLNQYELRNLKISCQQVSHHRAIPQRDPLQTNSHSTPPTRSFNATNNMSPKIIQPKFILNFCPPNQIHQPRPPRTTPRHPYTHLIYVRKKGELPSSLTTRKKSENQKPPTYLPDR